MLVHRSYLYRYLLLSVIYSRCRFIYVQIHIRSFQPVQLDSIPTPHYPPSTPDGPSVVPFRVVRLPLPLSLSLLCSWSGNRVDRLLNPKVPSPSIPLFFRPESESPDTYRSILQTSGNLLQPSSPVLVGLDFFLRVLTHRPLLPFSTTRFDLPILSSLDCPLPFVRVFLDPEESHKLYSGPRLLQHVSDGSSVPSPV